MNAATEVFSIPELLELILLSLPHANTHQEITSLRTILLSQTTCRTWYNLLKRSTPIRRALYLTTPLNSTEAATWNEKHPFPPAQPNPWIPNLLLNQRSWGSAYPFDDIYTTSNLRSSQPRHWTFTFEMSRMQFDATRKRPAGTWRDMLASSPPFTEFWYTRCVYELGSGRAPFVSHLDYDPSKRKGEQRYVRHCPEGVTLGDLWDAVRGLFEGDSEARFVMVESLRSESEVVDLRDDRPLERSYVPGSSAERAFGWNRGYWGD